jgi:hypothetical protein
MKKAIAILLAAAAIFSSVNASAQDKWVFNHLGIGVSAGLDGFGADLIVPITPFFQLRGGYAMQPLSYDIEQAKFNPNMSKANGDVWNLNQDIVPRVQANLDAAHLFLDIYPGKKTGLHFTVGAYYGMHPENGGPYRLTTTEPLGIDEEDKGSVGVVLNEEEGRKITTDKDGNLMLDISLGNPLAEKYGIPANIYPYAGIGFGRNLSRHRIGFSMDLGVIYSGRLGLNGYDYSREATAGVQNVPIHAADLQALKEINDGSFAGIVDKIAPYYEKAESLPVTPVLKFNLTFRLF